MITELEFKSLAADGHNRIPLIAEAFADLETPLSLYLKLAGGQKHGFLLESVVGGERFGRYSFIGLPARTLLRATGFTTEIVTDGTVVETHEGNPLDFIAQYQKRFKVALRPGMPRFCGGLAGYFGYDTVRYIEPKLARTQKTGGLDTPDILLLQTEELAVIDNLSGRLYLIVYADPTQSEAYFRAKKRLAELTDKLKYSVTAPAVKRGPSHAVEREFSKEAYIAAVLKSKEYIAAGDMMQVQIGQRLKKRYTESPLSLYRALRSLNPSPYMYFYDMGDFQIVGASPEILVRQEHTPEGQKITVRPIAGTKPRGETPEADKAMEAELLSDPKERAEHLMLIDLARNDIGRIAKTGSVKVTEAFEVERYSHVMHIVSNVEGLLKDGMTSLDVLKAAFPAGTLTGAPKIRAMQIIDELEPVKRGIYGGACGYLSFAGDMDVAIAIRTGIVMDNTLYVQAAAGVVADSIPEMEWKETEVKARALMRAAELVEEGFLTGDAMLLMIDNYDSFTFNLVQYFGELGEEVRVVRNDEITLDGIAALRPDQLVLSPGPCSPAEAGICIEAIRHFAGKLPILGVCLGHQAIGAALGGRVIRAQKQMHGKTSEIATDGQGVYRDLPKQFTVVRYHSLAIERETLPVLLDVTSTSEDGEIMGVRHRELAGTSTPLEGVQFHPESILSEHGHAMLRNFLQMSKNARSGVNGTRA